MSTSDPRGRRPSQTSWVRRIATIVTLSALVFVVLWLMAFSFLTSLLIASGCCVVVVAASSVSDLVEIVLDAISAVVFGILAAIAAIFGAIFGLFGF
jgi:hypothetical protein